MKTIQEYFKSRCRQDTDINEHLPTLRKYAEKCDHITEFGFRGGESTCAFLAGKPKKLVTYDKDPGCEKTYKKLKPMANGTEFVFRCEDSGGAVIENTDLLFIDSYHTYGQAKAELNQAHRVNRFVILHDTQTFGPTGEDGGKGLGLAIIEFVRRTKKWEIHHHYSNNNGLTILKRRNLNG